MHRQARLLALFAIALCALVVAQAVPSATPTDSAELRDEVTVGAICDHQEAFQAIADANDDTRAAGTTGYDQSLAYVKGLLDATGYFTTTVQEFDFPFFQELAPAEFERISPDPETYALDDDFATTTYSGSGNVQGSLVATNDIVIPPGAAASTSNSGCEPSDFVTASATELQVALIQRSTCDFSVKAANAEAAGYDAVVIFNEGTPGRPDRQTTLFGTLGTPDATTLPVIGTSFEVGEALYDLLQDGPVVVRVETSTRSETRTTSNLIADMDTGRTDRVVVLGAHLDSVTEGPGINDNGSGSATILEIALQMADLGIEPRNQVRFAWWGAEEAGLFGSQFYVDQLSKSQVKDIAVNLNFDMVGSPNYVRFVYDGDASDTDSLGSSGSGAVEDVFLDYFQAVGLAAGPTAFDGRSDYDAFISVCIPAGGLFTGAEEIKTAEQAAIYGGTAGLAFDPCYHQACDHIDNNSDAALDEMSDAAAHATLTFAMTTSAVEGTDKGKALGHGKFKGLSLRK
jgi:Zn-dependent M28 family amino/carboxypeptidase